MATAGSYNVAYSNLQPALASTMPPRPPSDAVFTDHLASSSLSPGVGPRVGYPQPNTPHYQVASQTSAFQHQQSSKQFPYHTTTGQRRNSTSIPNKGPNRPTPYHPSRSHNLQGIAESSLLPQSRSDATLSGFLVQLTDKLQDHLKAQSNSKPDESSLAALLPTPNMLRYAALCGLWYASSAISNNTGKDILARFRYPVSLTLVQFGIVSFYCVLFCAIRQALSPPLAYQRPWFQILFTPAPPGVLWWKELLAAFGVKRASKTALHGTLIMSFFQITGHVFSSMATASMPVSTVHTIKALSPLFTVLSYALLFRVKYSSSTYLSLVPLTFGVMLACSPDLRANLPGSVFALGSTIIFVSQNIFSKKLLPKESTEDAVNSPSISSRSTHHQQGVKLDKINLLLYSSGMAFLLMIPMWAYTDLAALLAPKPTPPHPVSATTLFLLFLLNGSVHFAQCFLAFTILARSSPVAYSIASLIKRVAVICLAILWFGQSVGLVQTVGMLMTFTGLWMYNRAKADVHRGERKRHAAERRANLLLPTTQGEARMMDSALSSRAPTPDMSPSATPIPTDMRQSASPIPGAHGLCTSAMSQRSIYHPAPRSPTHLLPLPQKNTWRDSTVHPTPSPAEGITNQMQPLSAGPSKHRANHSLDVGHRQ